LKVLIISPFSKPDLGGVESHLEKLTTYLCEKKEISVILVTYMPLTSNLRPPKYEKKGNLEIIRMPWFGKGWFRKLEPYFPLNMVYLFPGLFYRCFFLYVKRHAEFDVIHAHGFISGAIAKILNKIKPKRIVISTHAIYSLVPGTLRANLFKWLLSGFDKVLAVGEPSLLEILAIGIPKEKVCVHPNWVDLSQYDMSKRDEARISFGFDPTDFIALFVGRMIGIKGELVLLDVAKTTAENIKFVFVGGGPEASQIEKEALNNKKVIYLGKLPDEKMESIYCAADAFVSPVQYEEGFATVYLEALSCGVPVITAKRGCLPYFLSSEVAEILETPDTSSVRRALEQSYFDRANLPAKRVICRSFAERNFSEKNVEVIIASYSK
jgi:glycosyltransferase involved in cell wall biosynthesis